MGAPKGNKFWEARTKHGRDKLFGSPELLWEACCEYFQWVEENPLLEENLFAFQGSVTRADATKMRAMTIQGLCLFLGINISTWHDWRKDKDFSIVVSQADFVIYQQKLTGAAAGLLNANIIARELGLKDSTDNNHTSQDGSMSPAPTKIVITGRKSKDD